MPFFHASPTNLGQEFSFDRGGFYESVDDRGTPEQRLYAGEFAGFQHSDTPELAASKSPEAALFAQLKNLSEGSCNTGTHSTPVTLYRLDDEPDLEIVSNLGDFPLIEEVRYRHPSDT